MRRYGRAKRSGGCEVGRRSGAALGIDAVFHAVAFPVDNDGFSVMEDAVEDRGGESAVVVEDGRPVFVGFVGGQHDGAAFVPLADYLEEQIGTALVDGQVSEFVHQQDSGTEIFLEFDGQASSVLRGGERVDDVNGCGEQNAVTSLTGGMAQRDAQVTFSQAHAADKNHIRFVFDELEAEEILDLSAIDFAGPGEVELVERLDDRKACQADAALACAFLVFMRLAVDQTAEELHVRPLRGGGLTG